MDLAERDKERADTEKASYNVCCAYMLFASSELTCLCRPKTQKEDRLTTMNERLHLCIILAFGLAYSHSKVVSLSYICVL